MLIEQLAATLEAMAHLFTSLSASTVVLLAI